MKIRIHRINVSKKSGQLLSWFTGRIVDSIEGVDFSHVYVEIIDEFGVPFAVDNLTGSFLRIVEEGEPWKHYDPGGIWERDLTHKEYEKVRDILERLVGVYYSPWKVISLKPRQWFGVPGNLSGTISPEIIARIINTLHGTRVIPELVGMRELVSLIGTDWRDISEDSNT